MSILSIKFIFFLLCAVFLYYKIPQSRQWSMLLVLSVSFYLMADAKAIVVILTVILTVYYFAGKIDEETEYLGRRFWLIGALFIIFGMLFIIKYIKIFEGVFPLGISYYSFQAAGYMIDVYRKKIKAEKSLPKLMLFISFFPQLFQGPISRYSDLSGQLLTYHRFSIDKVWSGIELMVWGAFKKLVIANRLSVITGTIFSNTQVFEGLFLWIAAFFSMLELYMDFSAGIDLARGAAEIFDISLPENFIRPFFAKSVGEYWRRWHCTLNNWWRDYIFYPLTLSREARQLGKKIEKIFGTKSGRKFPVICALLIVRVVNSVWHGMTQCTLLIGMYYGVILAASLCMENCISGWTKKMKINKGCVSFKAFQCIRTFLLISTPRMIINAGSLAEGIQIIKRAVSVYNPWILFDGSLFELGVGAAQFRFMIYSMIFVFVISLVQERGIYMRGWIREQNVVARGIIYIFFASIIVTLGVYGSGYDATVFTYAQF